MVQIADNLWIEERPQRFMGLELGTRMTVVRLHDGSLFAHSPVHLDRALREGLDRLGPMRFVVAPNKLHHLYVGDYFNAYPEARIYCAPGLDKKRADLNFHGTLGSDMLAPWPEQIAQLLFPQPALNEVLFLDRASRTLLLTDIAFNLKAASTRTQRLLLTLNDGLGHFGPTRLARLLMRRDSARSAIESVLGWDFDRIVLTHGDIVSSGGKAAMRQAFSFLF